MQLNEVGYPILSRRAASEGIRLSPRPVADPQRLERSQGLLSRFGIPLTSRLPGELCTTETSLSPNSSETDINEHFEAMAAEFVDEYVEEGDRFASDPLPQIPGLDDHRLRARMDQIH